MGSSRAARRSLAAFCGVLTTLTLAACGSSSGGAAGGSDTIKIAIEQTVNNLDPLVTNSAPILQMYGAALDKVGMKGGVTADLATSWTPNAAATVWTYALRPGVKFSNGTPVTAADVAFSFTTVKNNPKSLQNVYLAAMKSVVARGDQVVFTLNIPNATWPSITTQLAIVPKASYDAKTFESKPITAGPYTVVSFNGTNTVRLKANPTYYGGKPQIANATVESVADETTRLNGLQSGQFDAALLSGNNIAVAKSAGLTVQSVTGSKVIYLGYNVTEQSLQSEKLRQAISYAINRSALVKNILSGYGSPTDQMLSPTTFGYDPSYGVPAQDIAKAKQLVQASGYAGRQILLQYPTGYLPSPSDSAQAVASYLKQVGINVKLSSMDATAFLTDWATKKLPAMWLFSQQTITLEGSGTFNFTDNVLATTTDKTLPTLYTKELGQLNSTERTKTMAAMNAYRNAHAFYTPLFVQNFTYVHDKKFTLPTAPANGYPNPLYFTASS